MNNEQSITLLRQSKRALAEAFTDVGMQGVTEHSRAAEFGKRIRWATGLLDITLACQRVSDGSHWYFTESEWDSLTNENKQLFLMRGLRVRALGHSFVLAPADVKSAEGNSTMAWGNATADIPDLDNRGTGELYNSFHGRENTQLILAAVKNDSLPAFTSAPAAQQASAYHSYRREDGDALDDESDWHLPGLGVLVVCYRWCTEINAAFNRYWGTDSVLKAADYWSSDEWDATSKWYMSVSSGVLSVGNAATEKKYVRPVADEV